MTRVADVSIVMATYNGQEYISEQLCSILNQTVLPSEIIVIDDCSTDSTVAIMEHVLKRNTVNYNIVVNKKNRGVNKSFETGIKIAKSSIVMISDQDDIWDEKKIEYTEKMLQEHKDVVMTVCDATIVDSHLVSEGKTMYQYIGLPLNFADKNYILGTTEAQKLLLRRNFVTGMCMAIRKDIALKAVPFSENMIYDAWMAWVASRYGNISFINRTLVYYRQHEKNVVGTKVKYKKINTYYLQRRKSKLKLLAKYKDFLENASGDDIKSCVAEACEFHEWRCRFSEYNTVLLLIQLAKNIFSGKYKLYTGASKNEIIKDLIEILFYRTTH